MMIAELRKRRGGQVLLVPDEGEPVLVDRRTFEESPYRVGSSLSEEALSALLEESERRRAREKALFLLSGRDHSRRELEEKLRRTAGRQAAMETAARMEELGLVDDRRFADRLAQELIHRRYFSRRRAVQELCARGVDRETAVRAVEETESDDLEQALALLRKKYYNTLDTAEARRRTAAALMRYGFDGPTIRRAMESSGVGAYDDDRDNGFDD